MRFSLLPPAAVLVSVGTLACALPASAGDKAAADWVYRIDEKIAGKTHAEWTVTWFQWLLAIKKDRNPSVDPTGKFAGEGQSGPVWFLGGNFGGVMRRTVIVPAGKPIFSPVLYSLHSPSAAAKGRAEMDAARDMDVKLDGKSLGDVSKFRVITPAFTFTGPAKDDAIHPILAGKRTMAANGYWFMLKPLPAGEHTLRIRGRLEGGFNLSLTYQLKVVDR